MNAGDKKKIKKILDQLQKQLEAIDLIRSNSKDKLKSMPPRTQALGFKGEKLEEEISLLETASSELTNALDDLCTVIY